MTINKGVAIPRLKTTALTQSVVNLWLKLGFFKDFESHCSGLKNQILAVTCQPIALGSIKAY